MRTTLRLLAAGLFMTGATGVLAQTAGTSTTGQNIDSAGAFRNITPTGVTKPPGAAAAPDTPVKPDDKGKRPKSEGSGIKGICIGCN
ncbi:hypothetical protein FPV16_01145 [Methylobacterium sp. W2]|uniref:hypothetical protein n=1 Tax=Methylobacterium sp. W2 TaxID=2598107 RepID=UPI001D0C7BF3|nr:hypothetical protein [Methylobacterium sp. W2]MCC0804838.1 hypothetical protein [Methylobacterium sp. W2]